VGAATAQVGVVALPDPADVLKVATLVREKFPGAKVIARARNRRAAHLLMDVGVTDQVRETFFSSLKMSEIVLRSLDFSEEEARRTVARFRERDEQMLIDQHAFYEDEVQLVQTSAQAAEELRSLFEADAQT
jgi:voltage-gated potassium channel Kch